MLRRYFIYGNLGIFMEVFWTGMQSFIKRGDICLTGTTSVIMFFIYGLVVFMEPLFKQLKGQSAIVRGMTYGLLIFAIEFFSGTGLKAVNACPWDYSSAVYNINGLVRLDYYPVWIFVGLVYERIYSFLKYNKRRLKNRPSLDLKQHILLLKGYPHRALQINKLAITPTKLATRAPARVYRVCFTFIDIKYRLIV